MAIADRRVVPGHAPEYLAAMRAVSQSFAYGDGRGEMRAVIDDSDPDRVLVLGRWPTRGDLEHAVSRLPASLMAEAQSHLADEDRPLRWYRIEREIERIAVRAGYSVARRYNVAPRKWVRFERWMVGVMRALVDVPGVVSQSLLVDLDAPASVIYLAQYTGPEVVAAALRSADAQPSPPALASIVAERFAGRADLLWEQARPA
jgi:heme-degrading monooxygenase HmoA